MFDKAQDCLQQGASSLSHMAQIYGGKAAQGALGSGKQRSRNKSRRTYRTYMYFFLQIAGASLFFMLLLGVRASSPFVGSGKEDASNSLDFKSAARSLMDEAVGFQAGANQLLAHLSTDPTSKQKAEHSPPASPAGSVWQGVATGATATTGGRREGTSGSGPAGAAIGSSPTGQSGGAGARAGGTSDGMEKKGRGEGVLQVKTEDEKRKSAEEGSLPNKTGVHLEEKQGSGSAAPAPPLPTAEPPPINDVSAASVARITLEMVTRQVAVKEEVLLPPVVPQPLGEERLGFQLDKVKLKSIFLQLEYWWGDFQLPLPILPDNCTGALTCPHFGKCEPTPNRPAFAMCRNPDLVDPMLKGDLAQNDPLRSRRDLPEDSPLLERGVQLPFVGNVFLLENVYLSAMGHVFNRTHFYMGGGCTRFSNFAHGPNTTVTRFKLLANAITRHSNNFFHTMMEILPDFIVLSPILNQPQHKNLPIAFHQEQDQAGPSSTWLNLLGFNTSRMNIHRVNHKGHLFFAEQLLVPAHGLCGKPSGAVLEKLRTQYLGMAPACAVNYEVWRKARGPDWKVVVGARLKKSRKIKQQGEILDALTRLYGAQHVTVFWGNLSVEGTKSAFRGGVLYIGPHGAGMTNLIFMSPGTAVLELRPEKYVNNCYQYLSDRCKLLYFRVFGEGDFDTDIDVNTTEVIDTVKSILPLDKVEI